MATMNLKYLYLLYIPGLILLGTPNQGAVAQIPTIGSMEKSPGISGERLILAGSGFGNQISGLSVRFGAAGAEILHASEHLIEVKIPPGATYDYISVTNLSSALSGHTTRRFLPTYNGTPFDAARLSKSGDLNPGFNLYDLCTCDFDGDGLNDLALADQTEGMSAGSIMVFRNTTPSNSSDIQFTRITDIDLVTGTAVRNIACADLNGDGKPDLVVGKGGNTADRLFLLMNNSTSGNIDFAAFRTLMISGNSSSNSARRIKVHDLNADGKPEIILADQNQPRVHVFQNRSTIALFSFPLTEKVEIQSPLTHSTSGLDIADLDGDGRPEVVFNSANAPGLFVVPNRSSYGQVAMGSPVSLSVTEALNNVIAVDLDGDGLTDLAATSSETNRLKVLLKNSASNPGGFASALTVAGGTRPWGLAAGDVDGNGKPDLLAATADPTAPLSLFLNLSTPGSLSLQRHNIGPAELSINALIADLNGDAKPDLAYTTNQKKVVFIQNQQCVMPVVLPSDPAPICGGQAITLRTPVMPKTQIRWEDGLGNQSGIGQYQYSTVTAGQYRAVLSSAADGCLQNSAYTTLVSGGSSAVPTPAIDSPGLICAGDSLVLSTVPSGSLSYVWIKPDGSTHTAPSLIIPDSRMEHAGRYRLLAVAPGGCRSEAATALVEIAEVPGATISAHSGSPFCTGTQNILTTAAVSGGSYRWYRNNALIGQTTVHQYTITSGGTYRVEVQNASGCAAVSPDLTLVSVAKPAAAFESPNSLCVGDALEPQNTSIYDAAHPPKMRWDFGDDVFSTEFQPRHSYSEPGTFYPWLELYYESDTACSSRYGHPVEVQGTVGSPSILIDGAVQSGAQYALCPDDTLTLSTTAGPAGLLWNTGATTASILVHSPGKYSLTAGAGSNCERSSEIEIISAPSIEINVANRELNIREGESVQLLATGAESYTWTPSTFLNNAAIANPLARPPYSITYRVTGSNSYGCTDSDTVRILVEPVVLRTVDAPRIFTPNGDGFNDQWIIRNIDELRGCPIRIFNRQGLTVYEAPEYLNDWNGNAGSGEAPEGAYYYLISCPDGQILRGDITLVR
jgi:gliding motility-associated-like protein